MLVLTIRTDRPEAEIGLFDEQVELAYKKWNADRHLSETIYREISDLLQSQHKTLKDLSAIICFKGPGSFTGLRIGISVGNALAYGLSISVVGTSGDKWIADGLSKSANGKTENIVLPEYGSPPHITSPKH